MVVRVIIAISKRSLGEIIQQALLETGLYQAELVYGNAQFFSRVQAVKFSAAILDYRDIKDPPIFTRTLLDALPELKIIAFPPQESAEQTALSNLGISDWLSLPFYVPNLLDIIQNMALDTGDGILHAPIKISSAVLEEVPERSKPTHLTPEWLQDVNRVAQHLTRLFQESLAQAALITHGSQIWAYAGQLEQPAAEELSRTIGLHSAKGSGDLTRFIHLNATNSDFMLYATSLGGDFVLALTFETDVSFLEMRSHVEDIAQKLADPSQDWPDPLGDIAQVRVQIKPQQIQDTVPNDLGPLVSLQDEMPDIPIDWRPSQNAAEDRQAFFEELLTSIDIPDTEEREFEQRSIPPVALNLADDEQKIIGSSVLKTDDSLKNYSSTFEERFVDPFLTAHSARIKEPSQINDTEKTQNRSFNIEDLEPETASMVNIAYTAVLIPRLPQHHLVGGLAEALPRWVNELSLAFGWRLDHLSVRPTYLHWRAISPPHYPPARMVLDMAMQTSQRIFAEFSRFNKANPSENFWAAGHLIVSGRDKLSQQLVQDFIVATRSRQGTWS